MKEMEASTSCRMVGDCGGEEVCLLCSSSFHLLSSLLVSFLSPIGFLPVGLKGLGFWVRKN